MNVQQAITQRLAALEPESVRLEDESAAHAGHAGAAPGGNTHWKLAIVARGFAQKNTVARHRMVYAALADLMNNPIHALQIRALTPEEAGDELRGAAGAPRHNRP